MRRKVTTARSHAPKVAKAARRCFCIPSATRKVTPPRQRRNLRGNSPRWTHCAPTPASLSFCSGSPNARPHSCRGAKTAKIAPATKAAKFCAEFSTDFPKIRPRPKPPIPPPGAPFHRAAISLARAMHSRRLNTSTTMPGRASRREYAPMGQAGLPGSPRLP